MRDSSVGAVATSSRSSVLIAARSLERLALPRGCSGLNMYIAVESKKFGDLIQSQGGCLSGEQKGGGFC